MKKAEFLAAVSGRTIRIEWNPGWTPEEKGAYAVRGLPESCAGVHPNQVRAWLRESFTPTEEKHPSLAAEQSRLEKLWDREDAGEKIMGCDFDDAYYWADAFEQHPVLVYVC